MKPCHLGNYASQTKNYWGTLSGSNGRSIRISHENSPEAPPCGEIMMTSHRVCNITSLSRKPCIPDKKLLKNAIRKSWSLFQNPSWKIVWSAPWRRNHDDVLSALQWNLIISETINPRWNVTMERYEEVMVTLSKSVMKNCLKRFLVDKSRWRHIRLAIKISLSRTPCIPDKKLL